VIPLYISKEDFWSALREPYAKDCTNCARGWDCTFIVPDCMHNFDLSKRSKHWVWDEKNEGTLIR